MTIVTWFAVRWCDRRSDSSVSKCPGNDIQFVCNCEPNRKRNGTLGRDESLSVGNNFGPEAAVTQIDLGLAPIAFGKNGARQAEFSRRADDIQATVEDLDNSACQEDDQCEDDVVTAESSENNQRKPLLDEVIVIAENKHCAELLKDRTKLQRLRKKVEDAESLGVSPSLTKSTINSSHGKSAFSSNPIAASFATVERHQESRFHQHAKDECHRDVEKDLASVKDTWATQGTSIVSDGWTNVKHQPLINVVASNSRGSMFLYAEDFSGVEKTGKAIADFILKSIDEVVGPSNLLQVVTDNAANCKAAGKEIKKVYKHIFWSPCVVHTLNLIFKDFATAFPWMIDTYKRGGNNVKFFLNHQHAHAIFRVHSKLELLKVAKTRFASHYILLKRLLDCREALATTTVLRAWKDWVTNCADERVRSLGSEVTVTISDDDFWDEVDIILTITKPIFLMIKFADGDGQKMGEVYEKMDCIIDRRAPNLDKEVASGVLQAFEKIGEDESESRKLLDQMAKFQGKEGIFGSNVAKEDAATMTPMSWWSTYGAETPELAEIASKVLSQPIDHIRRYFARNDVVRCHLRCFFFLLRSRPSTALAGTAKTPPTPQNCSTRTRKSICKTTTIRKALIPNIDEPAPNHVLFLRWRKAGEVQYQYTGVVRSHLISLKHLEKEDGQVAYCLHKYKNADERFLNRFAELARYFAAGARDALEALISMSLQRWSSLSEVELRDAACVALFSLDQHDAIPVDTHVGTTYLLPELAGSSLTLEQSHGVVDAFVSKYGNWLTYPNIKTLIHRRLCTFQFFTA
ncbi:hypothetical protein QQ045_005678 [Rhodiola kirilowii]